MSFTIEDKEYNIEFTQNRIEAIENNLNRSTLDIMYRSNGLMTLKELKTFAGYGLKRTGATAFVNPAQGLKIAEKLLEVNGYTKLLEEVTNAVERDCGFFFRAD